MPEGLPDRLMSFWNETWADPDAKPAPKKEEKPQ